MKYLFLFALLLILKQSYAQQIPIPAHYKLIDSAYGNLDNDSSKEMAAVYNTKIENPDSSENIPRELIIYKKNAGQWVAWQKSSQAIGGTQDGGMLGDPFAGIIIQNGILIINEEGGSSWKWNTTNSYRYQDGAFYLIGYHSFYGKLCEYWQEIDFNLSTGKLLFSKEFEDCDKKQQIYKRQKETLYKKGIKITLQQRNAKTITLTTPRYHEEIYIAIKEDE